MEIFIIYFMQIYCIVLNYCNFKIMKNILVRLYLNLIYKLSLFKKVVTFEESTHCKKQFILCFIQNLKCIILYTFNWLVTLKILKYTVFLLNSHTIFRLMSIDFWITTTIRTYALVSILFFS